MIGNAKAGFDISITGLGCKVPDRVLTNNELSQYVDTSDEWIVERTGIRERRMAAPEEALSDLALPAARAALEQAGLEGKDIDLIIVATVTPDMAFPSTAALVADQLGATDAAAYDLSAGCTGFMYALAQGYGLPAGGSRAFEDPERFVKMNGREVFKFATRILVQSAEDLLARCEVTIDDVDLYIPHQANVRIIEHATRKLGVPSDRVVINVDRYGNTSSGSIPLALADALADGRLRPGQLVLMTGMGAGLTWGSALMRWTMEAAAGRS